MRIELSRLIKDVDKVEGWLDHLNFSLTPLYRRRVVTDKGAYILTAEPIIVDGTHLRSDR